MLACVFEPFCWVTPHPIDPFQKKYIMYVQKRVYGLAIEDHKHASMLKLIKSLVLEFVQLPGQVQNKKNCVMLIFPCENRISNNMLLKVCCEVDSRCLAIVGIGRHVKFDPNFDASVKKSDADLPVWKPRFCHRWIWMVSWSAYERHKWIHPCNSWWHSTRHMLFWQTGCFHMGPSKIPLSNKLAFLCCLLSWSLCATVIHSQFWTFFPGATRICGKQTNLFHSWLLHLSVSQKKTSVDSQFHSLHN